MQSDLRKSKDTEACRAHRLTPTAVRWGEDRREDLCCGPVIVLFSLNIIKRNLSNYPEMGWSAAKHRQE